MRGVLLQGTSLLVRNVFLSSIRELRKDPVDPVNPVRRLLDRINRISRKCSAFTDEKQKDGGLDGFREFRA